MEMTLIKVLCFMSVVSFCKKQCFFAGEFQAHKAELDCIYCEMCLIRELHFLMAVCVLDTSCSFLVPSNFEPHFVTHECDIFGGVPFVMHYFEQPLLLLRPFKCM